MLGRRLDQKEASAQQMCAKVVLLGCAQDAGLPQMGCACLQCDHARQNPDYNDGMVVSLALVDEAEGKVFLIDATPNLQTQLWHIQHADKQGRRPLDLGGILLTHAHTGHYTGLLQLGKEGADMRGVPVFCTPSMANFLRNNQPWAQLAERGNITIHELDMSPTGSSSGGNAKAVRLTPSLSFVPVLVPHRAELSDTVAYLVSLSSQQAVPAGEKQTMNVLYCPDTDGWGGWPRSIRSWCEEVDVALLDATFYSKGELKGRDMKEVSHPIVQDTIAQLTGVKAEVVLIHLNHTNPLLSVNSPERAEAVAGGFTVGAFGLEWALPSKTVA
eukprot:g8900.t1